MRAQRRILERLLIFGGHLGFLPLYKIAQTLASGTIRVEQKCACVRVREGLVLGVCLQVSCGAPPRPTALDPPL